MRNSKLYCQIKVSFEPEKYDSTTIDKKKLLKNLNGNL